jgi:hypothetical protein
LCGKFIPQILRHLKCTGGEAATGGHGGHLHCCGRLRGVLNSLQYSCRRQKQHYHHQEWRYRPSQFDLIAPINLRRFFAIVIFWHPESNHRVCQQGSHDQKDNGSDGQDEHGVAVDTIGRSRFRLEDVGQYRMPGTSLQKHHGRRPTEVEQNAGPLKRWRSTLYRFAFHPLWPASHHQQTVSRLCLSMHERCHWMWAPRTKIGY